MLCHTHTHFLTVAAGNNIWLMENPPRKCFSILPTNLSAWRYLGNRSTQSNRSIRDEHKFWNYKDSSMLLLHWRMLINRAHITTFCQMGLFGCQVWWIPSEEVATTPPLLWKGWVCFVAPLLLSPKHLFVSARNGRMWYHHEKYAPWFELSTVSMVSANNLQVCGHHILGCFFSPYCVIKLGE